MTAVSATDIRKARAYLQNRGVKSSDISPRRFASAAAEQGKGYAGTLKYLVLLLAGGSGEGASPVATANDDRIDPIKALGKPSPDQKQAYDDINP